MKTKSLIIYVLLMTVIGSAFTAASNFLQNFNASESEIKEALLDVSINGKTSSSFYNAGATNFYIIKNIVKGKLSLNKQEIVNEVMNYLKAYYNSDEFKTAHKEKIASTFGNMTITDSIVLKKQYEQNLKSLETAFENGKKYTTKAQMQKTTNSNTSSSGSAIDKTMEMLANNPQLAAQSGMTPEQIQQLLNQARQVNNSGKEQAQDYINGIDESAQQDDYQKRYELEKENLKKNYEAELAQIRRFALAADAKGNIKAALSDLIKLIDNVDFSAALINNRTFANKDYEAKSSYWKMTYRAGKENALLIRTAAQQWLNELQ